MRKQLIRTIVDAAISQDASVLLCNYVRELKCGNCQHYAGEPTEYMSGNCARLVDMNASGNVDADFVCALFEHK